MKKGALNILLGACFVLTFCLNICEAAGVAARNQRVRVQRTIRAVPPPPPSPDHPDAPRPEEEMKEKARPEAIPLKSYPQPKVLVSSSAARSRVVSSTPAPVDNPAASIEQELARIFSYLQDSSEIWTRINDHRIKLLIVGRYIDLYRQEGVIIRRPALYYAQLIDSMAGDNPSLLRRPFVEVLQIAAVVEYDFDNGQNKDALALQVLGSREAVVKNRQRLMRMQQ